VFLAGPGSGPSRQAHNDLESAIGTDTVAGLALAWEAQVDDGAVGDPITSLYGVHVNDARSVYGFDWDSGDRVWDYGVADADTMGQPFVHGERLHVDMITGSAARAVRRQCRARPGHRPRGHRARLRTSRRVL
jgi:hypothetical protein